MHPPMPKLPPRNINPKEGQYLKCLEIDVPAHLLECPMLNMASQLNIHMRWCEGTDGHRTVSKHIVKDPLCLPAARFLPRP